MTAGMFVLLLAVFAVGYAFTLFCDRVTARADGR